MSSRGRCVDTLGGSQGSPPSFCSSEQLRLESRPTSVGSPVPRGAGAGCARGIQARSGARPQAHMRSSITGGWCGLVGGESDSRLTRNSRENPSKVGSVLCKSLKRVGGKGGTRTLDPGIMSWLKITCRFNPLPRGARCTWHHEAPLSTTDSRKTPARQ